jgi:beta-glucosidase-like glycosyl hydrolase
MAMRHIDMLAPHMIVGLEGPRLSEEEKLLLSRHPFAGVILFDRNVRDARQLMELAREMKGLFRESHGHTPIIAADHEGGMISVLARAIGVPPTQMATARTGDLGLCERLFAENARRLRACGVNMLLGPVADINAEHLNPVIGTRSFGESEEVVSPFVARAAAAARKEGVLTCLKHFPGHGSSRVDSHLGLAVLAFTTEQLKEREIVPFAKGLSGGAETVMVGHVAPAGRALPASLDHEVIDGLLRRALGFEGVVMTDALEMRGVRAGGPCDEGAAGVSGAERGAVRPGDGENPILAICEWALAAGNDLLLFSRPTADVIMELEAGGASVQGNARAESDSPTFLKSSRARIDRLLEIASEKERQFELPSDPGIYGEIAEKSIRITEGSSAWTPIDRGRGFKAAFYSEKGGLERFPARSFVTKVLAGLGAGRAVWGTGRAEGTDRRPDGRSAEHRIEPAQRMPDAGFGLEGEVFSTGESSAPVDAVFLMNRRPLSAEAVGHVCAGARVIVISGWPYAAELVHPGPRVVVTFGVYDAAADCVCGHLAGG